MLGATGALVHALKSMTGPSIGTHIGLHSARNRPCEWRTWWRCLDGRMARLDDWIVFMWIRLMEDGESVGGCCPAVCHKRIHEKQLLIEKHCRPDRLPMNQPSPASSDHLQAQTRPTRFNDVIKESAMQLISEVMTRNVQFVTPQETVRRAAAIMDDLNVGALPVCDGERLVGMLTDRDITVRATSAGLGPDDTVVDDIMTTDVRWCFEDQPLEEVMQQMADTQIRRVPVVTHDDAHRLVGIVSLGDIVTMSADGAQKRDIDAVLEKISSPSEPDRSSTGAGAGTAGSAGALGASRGADSGGGLGGGIGGSSGVATGAGLAGSDVLADVMNPGIEVSSTADPSDFVEVTPADLVNRNAPGSTTLSTDGPGGVKASQAARPGNGEGVTVRHVDARGQDGSSGESGAPEGIGIGSPGSASGGTAGVAGSAGTDVSAKP
jgi:CBS domain-containing protein